MSKAKVSHSCPVCGDVNNTRCRRVEKISDCYGACPVCKSEACSSKRFQHWAKKGETLLCPVKTKFKVHVDVALMDAAPWIFLVRRADREKDGVYVFERFDLFSPKVEEDSFLGKLHDDVDPKHTGYRVPLRSFRRAERKLLAKVVRAMRAWLDEREADRDAANAERREERS